MTLVFTGHMKNGDTVDFEVPLPEVQIDPAEFTKRVDTIKKNIFAELGAVGIYRVNKQGEEELIPAHMFTRFTCKERTIELVN